MKKFANIIETTNGFQVLCSIKQADEENGYILSMETGINNEDLTTIEMKLSIAEGEEESMIQTLSGFTDEDADALRDGVLEVLTDDLAIKSLNIQPSKS